MLHSALRFVPLLALIAVTAGCGQAVHPGSVTGKVTLDGTPVTKGSVTFEPVGQGTVAFGPIAADGTYTIDTIAAKGILPGEYFVTARSEGPIPPAAPNMAPAPPPLLTPPKYASKESTPLRAKIVAGANTFDIPMTSQ